MESTLQDLMQEATRLTRSGRLSEATGVIQRALGGWSGEPPDPRSDVIDGCVFDVEPAPATAPGKLPLSSGASEPVAEKGPGAFVAGTFTHASRSLDYKLYVPPGGTSGRPLPLVVMLHGCTQDPDDFALGTGMNDRARAQGFFVLYPAQSKGANPQGCWNWFKHGHQSRGRGEPAVIAALTHQVMQSHAVDPRRVFIAGLSAGGAMAAVVAEAYPELFAAVGVHSGLPTGAAANLSEALSAMRGQGPALARPRAAAATRHVPAIVFHGDEDKTVHQRNGEQLIAAAIADEGGAAARASPAAVRVERGVAAQGRRYTRSVHLDARGTAVAEHWLVHGAGHAWSGGVAAGSYTDPRGPDATEAMLRFFFEHPHGDPRPL